MAKQRQKKRIQQRNRRPHFLILAFEWFNQYVWAVISVIVIAVFTIVGGINDIYDFIFFWPERKIDLLIYTGVFVYVLVLATFVVILVRPPQFLIARFSKKGELIFKSCIILSLLSLLSGLFVARHEIQHQRDIEKEKTIILVAKFIGPEPENYQVTEDLLFKMRQSLYDFDDIVIVPWPDPIQEWDDEKKIQRLSNQYNADLIIWGRYSIADDDVILNIHIENFTELSFLDLSKSNAYTDIIFDQLEHFEFRTLFSERMSAFILFINGMILFEAGEVETSVARLTAALEPGVWPENLVGLDNVYYYRGNSFTWLDDFDSAIADYTFAINELNTENSRIFSARGGSYRVNGENELALRDFAQALDLDPNNASAYYYRAITYADLGKYEQALEDLSITIKLKPQTYLFWLTRGIIYKTNGQTELAIQDYNKAIELDPDDPRAYNNRGNAYTTLNQYSDALDDYEIALNIDSNSAHVYMNRGVVYEKIGRHLDAMLDYSKAVELDPDLTQANQYLQESFKYQENINLGIQHYSRLIHSKQDEAINYVSRGKLLQQNNELGLALTDFSTAITLDPMIADSYIARAEAYHQNNNLDLALADFSKAIDLEPNKGRHYALRANVYITAKQSQKALADLNMAIKLSPRNTDYYKSRSEIYLELDEFNKAIVDFTKIIELEPLIANYEARGEAYLDNGNFELAIGDFTTIISIESELGKSKSFFVEDHSDAYAKRGKAYASLGENHRASEDYNKAISLNNDQTEAYFLRGLLASSLNNHEGAIEDFSYAINHTLENDDPRLIKVWLNEEGHARAIALHSGPETLERATFYAVNFYTDHLADAYLARAKSYLVLKKLEQAKSDLFKALKLTNEDEISREVENLLIKHDFGKGEN